MGKRSGCIAVAVCTLLFLAFCAWMATFLSYGLEDWIHFDASSLKEGFYLASQAYVSYNPRIGEMLMYVQGGVMDNPLLLFQFINPLCLCLLVHFCFRLGTGHWAGAKAGDVIALLFCMFSVLSIHSGIYWYASCANWLYPCTAAAGLLIAVERVFRGDFHFSLGRVLWMLPLAVITGMSNNNTSVVVTALICASWPYAMLKQKRWIAPSAGCWLLVLVLLAAFFCYYLAPGNAARMETADWELSLSCWLNKSILFVGNWQYALMCLFCPLFMLAVLLGISLISRQGAMLKQPRLLLTGLVCFLLWAVLTLAPVWGMPRAFVPIDIAFACLLTGMVCRLIFSPARRVWTSRGTGIRYHYSAIIQVDGAGKDSGRDSHAGLRCSRCRGA